jgi:hypothetical protein
VSVKKLCFLQGKRGPPTASSASTQSRSFTLEAGRKGGQDCITSLLYSLNAFLHFFLLTFLPYCLTVLPYRHRPYKGLGHEIELKYLNF